MVDKNCVKSVKKLMGDTISEDDLTDLFEEASEQAQRMKRQNTKPVSKAMREWIDNQKDTTERDALIQKMNTANNTIAVANGIRSIEANFQTGRDMANGVPGLLQGDGARTEFSADSLKDVYMNRWMGELDLELSKIGDDAIGVLNRGDSDLQILQAREALNKGDDISGMDKYMVDIARVLNRVDDAKRADLNESGAFIGKLDDHHWQQMHDQAKIKREGEPAWRTMMDEEIDIDRTFKFSAEDMAADPKLREIYDTVMKRWYQDFSTGNHLRVTPQAPSRGVGTGGGNVAKRISHERKIHFKSAESFQRYQKQFGVGTMKEAIMMNLRSSSRTVALLQKFGPNYKDNAKRMNDTLIKRAKASGDNEAVEALGQNGKAIERAMAVADGSIDIPDSAMAAKVAQNIRSVIGMASLGGAALSAISDNAAIMANSRINGRSMFSDTFDAITGLFSNVKGRAKMAKALGISQDYIRGGMVDAGTAADAAPGMLSSMQKVFYRYSFLTPMTNRNRASVAIAESAHLAELSEGNVKFADLDMAYQRKLGLHDIGDVEWEALKHGIEEVTFGSERNILMTPEGVRDIDKAVITKMLEDKGDTVSARNITIARRDLENKVRSFYQDTVDKTIIEPKGRTRATILANTQEGTTAGIMARMMMQFKSFPMAVMMQRMQADIFLNTGKRALTTEATLKETLRQKGSGIRDSGSWGAMGTNIVTFTAWGYMAMMLKDLAKGNTPADPTESIEQAAKIAGAAFLQGGGAGLFGDFLFSESNRFGGGLAASVAGPGISKAGDALSIVFADLPKDIYGFIKSDTTGEGRNAQAWGNGLKFIFNNTPYANLFYTKKALDYFVIDAINNTMRPGTMERRQKQKLLERGQDSWWGVNTEGF